METTSTFGQWLKQRRHELDLTQEAVAEAASCSIETIRKIESGQRRPSRQMAEVLADHLHVDPRVRPAFVLWARGASDTPTFDALTTEEREPQAPIASAVPRAAVPSRPTLTFALKASSSLPVLLTPLVGRERELAHVRAMLWHSTTRLLTLLGPPGIGKTTLGIAVASSLQADFKDGLVYVPLGPIADPVLVAAAIGEGLGVRETSDRPLLDCLQDVLRDKQMLPHPR